MALQKSVTLRNNGLDETESTIGASPTLEIRTGAPPANCAAGDTGTVLATMTLPADWLTTASGGAVNMVGTWEDTSADSTGTAAHFRIKAGATCHLQGTVTGTGGGGDMELDNVSIAVTQTVAVTTFTITAGNA
jgi:hypothetical protein